MNYELGIMNVVCGTAARSLRSLELGIRNAEFGIESVEPAAPLRRCHKKTAQSLPDGSALLFIYPHYHNTTLDTVMQGNQRQPKVIGGSLAQ